MMVGLGGDVPSWELSRYGLPLRFSALDDEGYSLRGNSRSLLYKGRERSHRFTVLNDGAFEYDVILKKEPSTNVVELLIDGAEYYDFYRQPYFVKDDFLKGSYAVYRKENYAGCGTGKICHIHRPKIIDASGRWVWGDLIVAGNKLLIVIPEQWLADASYPVIVDPVIGTNTVGSQEEWSYGGGQRISFEMRIPVNRFVITDNLSPRFYARRIFTVILIVANAVGILFYIPMWAISLNTERARMSNLLI
jgi:hypothetical protein